MRFEGLAGAPSALYKYRGAQKLDRELDTLGADQIWAASPESLNDPFEATVLVDQDRFETFDLLAFGTPNEKTTVPRATRGPFIQFLEVFSKGEGGLELPGADDAVTHRDQVPALAA